MRDNLFPPGDIPEPLDKPKKRKKKKVKRDMPDITGLVTDPTLFVGLDLSLRSSGICHYFPNKDRFETDTMQTRLMAVERLDELEKRFKILINNCSKYVRPFVTIEGYSFASVNQLPQAGELGGLVKLLLYRANIPYIIVPPTKLKKYATSKGLCKKDAMPYICDKKWGVHFLTNDELDAYILARIGASLWYPKYITHEYERVIIEDLRTSWRGWTPF